MNRLLVTGAGGRLGSVLRPHLATLARARRLSDITAIKDATSEEECVTCDLSDFAAVRALVEGCDGIIHLGGIATEDSFDRLLSGNIIGTYNVYEAARQAGVKRVFLASSNHATGYHSTETTLDADAGFRPDSLYGATKVWSESIATLYHDKFGIETARVRIGSCWPRPNTARELKTWLSHGDLVRLVQCVFRAPELGCPVIYAVSDNTGCWWDNSKVACLGWAPKDSADIFREEFTDADALLDESDASQIYQGGTFAAAGHFED